MNNLINGKGKKGMEWWEGETLTSALESISILKNNRKLQQKTRIEISDVFNSHPQKIYAGNLISGIIQSQSLISIAPANVSAKITSLRHFNNENEVEKINLSDHNLFTFTLDQPFDDIKIKRGNLAGLVGESQPADVISFTALVLIDSINSEKDFRVGNSSCSHLPLRSCSLCYFSYLFKTWLANGRSHFIF